MLRWKLNAGWGADMIEPDFKVQIDISISVLHAKTQNAREWVHDHIPDDAQTWCGGIVIEPRFLDNVIEGIQQSGMTLEAF